MAKQLTSPPPPRKMSLASMFSATSPRPSHANLNGFSDVGARKASVSSVAPSLRTENKEELDPEELFVKHTVAEVRTIQRKLRTDADAKQGELRNMVGERYRDLLQASASIISMSKASDHVLEILDDMQETLEDDTTDQRPKRTTISQKDDAHLRSLQSLTAHIRLLLDTPEHIWRLLEQKRYLHATWLFLLARVVHRSLANNTDEDDGLHNQGLDILDQFPLAQRQWDTISHFRSQITHKATLSLRDSGHSAENICATLLTLHLIDSKPLLEALTVLTTQRSKALQQATSRKPGIADAVKLTNRARRKARALAVRNTVGVVLELVATTLGTARGVFESKSKSSATLMHNTLLFIENDGTSEVAQIPPEQLRLSTSRILGKLSSSLLATLPSTIRSYKPYIDLSSTSTSVSSSDLSRKLSGWFRTSLEHLSISFKNWVDDLESASQIWSLLSWFRKQVDASILLEVSEKREISTVMENVCKMRIVTIWTSALQATGEIYKSNLQEALADSSARTLSQSHAFETLPILESAGATISASAFSDYRHHLHKQLTGRTPILDRILTPLESRTRHISADLQRMREDAAVDQNIAADLNKLYEAELSQLQNVILSTTTAESDLLVADFSDNPVEQLAFLARLSEELISWSGASLHSSNKKNTQGAFAAATSELHGRILDSWRQKSVHKSAQAYWTHFQQEVAGQALCAQEAVPTNISGSLLFALQELATALPKSSVAKAATGQLTTTSRLLDSFIRAVCETTCHDVAARQFERDLRLLRYLASLWDEYLLEVLRLLDDRLAGMNALDADVGSGDLSRLQLSLNPLLPPSSIAPDDSSALLRPSAPSVDAQFQPAMDVMKPGQRFALLLVGSVANS